MFLLQFISGLDGLQEKNQHEEDSLQLATEVFSWFPYTTNMRNEEKKLNEQ